MSVTLQSYCYLKNGTALQKTPKGTTLAIPGLRDLDNSPWRKTLKRAVNQDGARILELCTGALSVAELIKRHNELHPANTLTEADATAFLEAAVKGGLAAVSETPVTATGVRICGSFDWYCPEHTTVELTNRCNLRCEHCYRASSPEQDRYIDKAILLRYLSDFYAHGGSVIELTGGEATLHPDFFEIAAWCHEHTNNFAVLTNAYGITEEKADRLAAFKDNAVIGVSLDSHRPEFHSRFRGRPDAFEKTTKAIKLLAERGLFVRVGMSVTLENFFDIEDTIKLARSLGATKFTYSMVYDVGRAGESAIVQIKKLPDSKRYFDYYDRVFAENQDFLVTANAAQQASVRKGNCGLVHRTVTLGPDGILRPCVMFDKSLAIGDITAQTFEQIFSGGVGNKFAALPGPKPEICGDCPDYSYCANCVLRGLKTALEKGGCRWLNAEQAKKFSGHMNLCPKTCINSNEADSESLK